MLERSKVNAIARIKKLKKIVIRTLLTLGALFLLLLLLFSIPAVQTAAGKYVTRKVNTKYGTDIKVERLGLKWNGDLNLKRILIKDHHQDTLIYAESIATSILSASNAIDGNLELGDIDLNEVKCYLRVYKGETNDNISIFSDKFAPEQSNPDAPPFLLTSDHIHIEDAIFSFEDYNLTTPQVVYYHHLNASFKDFSLRDDIVDTEIEKLTFDASPYYHVDRLDGKFYYDPTKVLLEDFHLKTQNSEISGNLKLDSPDGMSDFNNAVKIDIAFAKADISTTDIVPFYDEIAPGKQFKLNGDFTGTLNNLKSSNVHITGLSKTQFDGDLHLEHLLHADSLKITAERAQIGTSYFDLKALLPDPLTDLPPQFVKLGKTQLNGSTVVTLNTIKTKGLVQTALGAIQLDIQLLDPQNVNLATYSGNVQFIDFNIGTFLNDDKVGRTSFNINVNGKGFIQEYLDTQLSGSIAYLEFNDYDYKNITIFGNLRTPVFNGELFIDDPNLTMNVDGIIDVTRELNNYDFTANIDKADLHKLKFIADSTAVLRGDMVMDMTGTGIEDAFGSLTFRNTSYQNKNDTYFFKDFTVTSSFDDKVVRTIAVNSSDIVDGTVSGKFKFEEVIPLFRNAIGSLYTNYQPETLTQDQFMDFDFTINNKIVEVFVPDLKLDPKTRVRGSVIANDSDFKLTFKSPGITAFGSLAQQIEVRVDNKNPLFNTYIAADSIYTKYYAVSGFNLINVTLKDTLFMRSEFKGGRSNKDAFDLSLYHTINEDGNSVLGFKKSSVLFKENTWLINKENNLLNNVVFDNNFNDMVINTLALNYRNEEIAIAGEVRDSTYKDLKASFVNVDIKNILDDIENINVEGTIDGNLSLLQRKGSYYPKSTVTIDGLKVNESLLGDLQLNISGDNSLTAYTIDSKLVNGKNTTLNAQGNIQVLEEQPIIDLDVNLDNFDIAPFSALGEDVITNIRGVIDGTARVTGDYRNPDIDGELQLLDGGFKIPYLNIDYTFGDSANVGLSEQRFEFKTVLVEDLKYETSGILNGTISHQYFRDWELDLDVLTDRLLVLDTEEDDEALYYGTAFISGEATIKGPTDELVIDVIAETEEGTIFNIPIDDTESIGDNSFIHFLSPEEKEARIKGEIIQTTELKGLSLNFDLDVDQDAEIEIVVDKKNGSTLRGRGAGTLLIEINTNGKFNMWGDFVAYEGVFNFKYGGLVQKQFTVQPLGNIRWDGNPFRALLDVSAVYRAQANPSILLENPSINRKIDVDVIINLEGELIQPIITFDLEYPNTSSTVTAELDYRLSDRNARELNAISLVSQSIFLSETSVSTAGAVNNVLETGSSILNSILFNNEDGIIDVGIDLVQADRTPDAQAAGRVGLTLSTQIANRVLINGKVGVPTGGLSESIIVGDVEVDFLLNEDGSLRAKVFNRQTDVQFVGETEGYTQGAGLSYSVDFNSFKELMRKIFKGKNKEVQEALEKKPSSEGKVAPDGVSFKQ